MFNLYVLFMKHLWLLIACSVLICSCRKEEDKSDTNKYYYWTGTVIDEVTGFPAGGATVSLGVHRFCEVPGYEAFGQGFNALSQPDGKFIIKVLKTSYPKIPPTGCSAFHAEKSNYAGSTEIEYRWSDNPFDGEIGVIALKPFATLKLRVKRDPITDTYESAEIWISRYKSLVYWYDHKIICTGTNFDETYTYPNLWSNTTYSIESGPVGRKLYYLVKPYYTRQIYLIPGINEVSVSFTHGY